MKSLISDKKWRSLLKEVPEHGQIVDLDAFNPVQGWQEQYYGLATVRHPNVHPCGWQTDKGLLVLDPEVTCWRPAEECTQKYTCFLQQWSTPDGGWGFRFC